VKNDLKAVNIDNVLVFDFVYKNFRYDFNNSAFR